MRLSNQDWTNPVLLLHLEFISAPSTTNWCVAWALLYRKVWFSWANSIFLKLQNVGRCLKLNGWISTGLVFHFDFGSRQSVEVFAKAKSDVVSKI